MIRSLGTIMITLILMFITVFGLMSKPVSALTPNPTCERSDSFLGFPYWFKYLDPVKEYDPVSKTDICRAKLNGIKDVWLIVAACVELLIKLSSMIAIGFIIFGGVSYIISQGAPDKTKKAQATAINAVVGLAISIVAAAVVSFIAGRF
ncbi:MAG: hypothetical protein Q7T41_00495 [Candidatus Saccharibacteria bacterium]|nr:hypothetical protein [Candidatus Saccharibacteria bacterium]